MKDEKISPKPTAEDQATSNAPSVTSTISLSKDSPLDVDSISDSYTIIFDLKNPPPGLASSNRKIFLIGWTPQKEGLPPVDKAHFVFVDPDGVGENEDGSVTIRGHINLPTIPKMGHIYNVKVKVKVDDTWDIAGTKITVNLN